MRTDLPLEVEQKLIEEAALASQKAYSPYSRIKIGSAILSKEGHIFTGANIENASYGLTVCAERLSLFKAVFEGERSFLAIAVYSEDVLPVPCGACLQVLAEFFTGKEWVIIVSKTGQLYRRFKELLPLKFKAGKKNEP